METRLKELLQERGLSISEFARHIGVLPSALSSKGNFKPTLRLMATYAAELNVPVWEMLYDCGEKSDKIGSGNESIECETVEFGCPRCAKKVTAQIKTWKDLSLMTPREKKVVEKLSTIYSPLIDDLTTTDKKQEEEGYEEQKNIETPELRIKELMKEKHLSQNELAEKVGMTKSNLSHALNGKGTMTMTLMERMAEGLGVDVYELIASKEEVEAERLRRKSVREGKEPIITNDLAFIKRCPYCGYGIRIALSIS